MGHVDNHVRAEFEACTGPLKDGYEPAADILVGLSAVKVMTVTGPAGVGKDTLMNASGVHRVIPDTTRFERPGEVNGVDRYFRGGELHLVRQDVVDGRYVQWDFVHGNFYGTRIDAYKPHTANLLDVVAQDLGKMRKLAPYFGGTAHSYIVVPTGQKLIEQLDGRGVISGTERTKRLQEGLGSLEQCLDDSNIYFICNDNRQVAGRQLRAIAEHHDYSEVYSEADDQAARNHGYNLFFDLRLELGDSPPL